MTQNPRPGGDFPPFFPRGPAAVQRRQTMGSTYSHDKKIPTDPIWVGFRVPFIWGVGGLGDTGPVPCSNMVKSSWTDRYASSKINDVPWAKIMGHIWR